MTFKHTTDAEYRTRFFEDLEVGERFVSDWTHLTTDEIVRFSTEFDRQYFHLDEEQAKASPFGGLIASGAHTFAVWNRINLNINGDIAWIAGIGFDEFRFPNPMRPDVDFRATSELLSKRESASDPTRGITVHHYQLITRSGDVLFTCQNPALVVRN